MISFCRTSFIIASFYLAEERIHKLRFDVTDLVRAAFYLGYSGQHFESLLASISSIKARIITIQS